MGPGDQAIVAMHCPTWLVDWFWGTAKCKNLRQLIRGPLRGRARLALAGDLHFFMRHSFKPYAPNGPSSLSPSMAPSPSELSTPAGASPQGLSPTSSRPATPTPSLRGYMSPSQLHQTLMARLTGSSSASRLAGSSPPAAQGTAPPAVGSGGQPQQPLQQQTGWPASGTGPVSAEQGQQAGQGQPPQQQQQQQLVFGRSMQMDGSSVPGGASPAGGSPLGGSPTLPSMLLSAETPAPVRGPQPFERQPSGSRWTAAASLAGRVILRRGSGSSVGETSAGGAAAQQDKAAGPGPEPSSPTVGDPSQLPAGLSSSRPSSAPVPVKDGSKKATLPILSPVHGSHLELTGLEGAPSLDFLPQQPTNVIAEPPAAAAKGIGPAAHDAASTAAPVAQEARSGAGQHKQHSSAPAALDAAAPAASAGSSPPGTPAVLASSGSLSGATPFSSWWPGLRSRSSRGGVPDAAKPGGEAGGKRLERLGSACKLALPACVPLTGTNACSLDLLLVGLCMR